MTRSLHEVLETAADDRSRREHHTVLAEVITYDDDTRSCSVQPVSGVTRATGEWVRLPTIHGVPVSGTSWAGFVIAAPLAAGDTVLLVFADSSLDRWLSGDGAVDPGDDRRRHLSDAIAIPAPEPNTSDAFSTGGDLVVGRRSGGVQIRVTAAGKVSIKSGSVDLVTVLYDLLTELQTTTVATMAGPQPLSSAAAIATLATNLDTIRVP